MAQVLNPDRVLGPGLDLVEVDRTPESDPPEMARALSEVERAPDRDQALDTARALPATGRDLPATGRDLPATGQALAAYAALRGARRF
jgi:hypothetical protein